MNNQLFCQRQKILRLASKHGINNVRVFGSTVRGDETKDSDIDLLVNVENGRDLFDVGAFLMDVEELLHKRIDVVTENALHHKIRKTILEEAVPL